MSWCEKSVLERKGHWLGGAEQGSLKERTWRGGTRVCVLGWPPHHKGERSCGASQRMNHCGVPPNWSFNRIEGPRVGRTDRAAALSTHTCQEQRGPNLFDLSPLSEDSCLVASNKQKRLSSAPNVMPPLIFPVPSSKGYYHSHLFILVFGLYL